MKSDINFADEKVQKNFADLENSKTENKKLYQWICRAFEDSKSLFKKICY